MMGDRIDVIVGPNAMQMGSRQKVAQAIVKQVNDKFTDRPFTMLGAAFAMAALEQSVIMLADERRGRLTTRPEYEELVREVGSMHMSLAEKARVAVIFDHAMGLSRLAGSATPDGLVNFDLTSGRNYQPSLALFAASQGYLPSAVCATDTGTYALNVAMVTALNMLEQHMP